MDRSNGDEGVAVEFLARRGSGRSTGIGEQGAHISRKTSDIWGHTRWSVVGTAFYFFARTFFALFFTGFGLATSGFFSVSR
jgi:hypothetical protein